MTFFFSFFAGLLHLQFMWFARQVHLRLRDESQSITDVPQLWSGEGTRRFYRGHAKPPVSFSQLLFPRRLTAPSEITLFIYMVYKKREFKKNLCGDESRFFPRVISAGGDR